MPDTIQQRALHYLYGQLRKARIAFGRAERKQDNAEEIVHLQEKIDVLEWLAGVALNGEDVLRKPVRPEELPFFLGNFLWLEEKGIDPVPIRPFFAGGYKIEFVSFEWAEDCALPMEDYGKTWRCWAEKPTEEERRTVEWLD